MTHTNNSVPFPAAPVWPKSAAELLSGAEWVWSETFGADGMLEIADLVAEDGTVLAAILIGEDGEMDRDSDGCGILVEGLGMDDIPWP